MLELSTPVQFVKGIGPRIAEMLGSKGIHTVEDLVYYLPFRYEDRANPRRIAELRPGEMASVIAEVRGSMLMRTRRMPLFELTVADLGAAPSGSRVPEAPAGLLFRAGAVRTRSTLKCLWFHGAHLKDRFHAGQVVALYGKVEQDRHGAIQLIQPQFEILGDANEKNGGSGMEFDQSLEVGRIVPVYESAAQAKLSSRWFRHTIHRTLDQLAPDLPDAVPGTILSRLGLPPRREALQQTHWPDLGESLGLLAEFRTAAQRRLVFEELFFLELGLEMKRRRLRAQPGIRFAIDDKVRQAVKRILPFHPTVAQKRALKEIAEDMQSPAPMRRLLQGDVGSGKTIVALQAAAIAIENGYQAALMAPTEILATQHFLSARRILAHTGYDVRLLTGSLEPEAKRATQQAIAQGEARFVVGTHALLSEGVEFARPGLVIVDEQHRFGVMQRFKLMKASATQPRAGDAGGNTAEPDVLVMTATPIPRTLALTLYGDLDLSVLDELPPERTPVVTRRVTDERAGEVWSFLRKQVAAGRQAYVVYPVIEGHEDEHPEFDFAGAEPARTSLKAAEQMHRKLKTEILPDLRLGLLHGKLSPEKKDAVMRSFAAGELDVLVSTTVIEVGVDVPNANLMIVEHADRFGLSQLHQLRGRIGRGSARSFCVLMTTGKVSEPAEKRLDAMVRTCNGFEIAELDFQQRGPGELFGTRQSGMPAFRVANLLRDREMIELARREAQQAMAQSDPDITPQELSRALVHVKTCWQRRYGLVEVG
ncbi:MAG: ATP-dependent DNA helicase RecG [Acidobacteria bacterium]|nr:ATP-dependent DNA helicase RecG [Acidobacteriota bacterium]